MSVTCINGLLSLALGMTHNLIPGKHNIGFCRRPAVLLLNIIYSTSSLLETHVQTENKMP